MYGQHQRSRSFSHFPQDYSKLQEVGGIPPSMTGGGIGGPNGGTTQQQSIQQSQSQQATASTPASPHESAAQPQTPHPANMGVMEQQQGGSMIDNLLRRMRDAAGITNAGMVAAGMPTAQGGGGSQTEELLMQQQQQQQQQQLMMMAMNGGGGAQAAMIQQMQGMMPGVGGGGYGAYPYMMNGMGSMYQQQQYPGMMNSAANYMNPYAQQQQQQLLYNQATAGMYGNLMYGGGGMYGASMYGQTTPGIYGNSMYGTGNSMYGGSMYGNNMISPYDYVGGISSGMGMGSSYPYSSYYRSADPYSNYQSHGYGARSGFGMGYSPYDSYSKQMYYPERTSSVKSLWARDYY